MEKLFEIINFDSEIIQLMNQIAPFRSQWSDNFIHRSLSLIKNIQLVKPVINMIDYDIINIKSLNYDFNQFNHFHTFTNIFQNYHHHKHTINHYLNQEQSNIIKDIFDTGLINSADNYYYLLFHLPFNQQLTQLINTIISNNLPSDFPPIYFKILSNNFIPAIIYDWIISNNYLLTNINIEITCQNCLVPTNLIILHSMDLLSTGIDLILETISNNLCSLLNLYKINNSEQLNIIYIPTPFHKKINNFKINCTINRLLISKLKNILSLSYNYTHFSNPISNLTVNGGSTKKGFNSNYITIWRSEEFSKVLIHELIHYYELEKGDYFDLISFTKLNISNNYPHYSKEFFTELQTWFVYTIINLSLINYQFNANDLRFILNYERLYSLFNIIKIFQHYDIQDIDHFLSNNPKYMINIHSSVLYYYILKGLFLFNVNPFVEFLMWPYQLYQIDKSRVSNITSQQLNKTMNCQQMKIFVNKILKIKPILNDSMTMMNLKYH